MQRLNRFIIRPWIKELGANCAFMLAILCGLQSKSGNLLDGSNWVLLKPIELLPHFPWLKKTAFYDVLKKLEKKKYLIIARKGKGGKGLAFSVPNSVMDQWNCKQHQLSFDLNEATKYKGIAYALVMDILCENFTSHIKINRHKISKDTGLAISTVSDIVKFIKDTPDLYLQSLQNRQLITDDEERYKPIWEIGRGYRVRDAKGNVSYTRDEQVALAS
jgi:hypothetical protein